MREILATLDSVAIPLIGGTIVFAIIHTQTMGNMCLNALVHCVT